MTQCKYCELREAKEGSEYCDNEDCKIAVETLNDIIKNNKQVIIPGKE